MNVGPSTHVNMAMGMTKNFGILVCMFKEAQFGHTKVVNEILSLVQPRVQKGFQLLYFCNLQHPSINNKDLSDRKYY